MRLDRVGAGAGGLGALGLEMVEEEAAMGLVLVEVVRGEDGRDDRDAGLQLHLHQAADHRFGDELVAVDAAVDDQAGGDDGVVGAGFGEPAGVERDLEGPGYLEEVDVLFTGVPSSAISLENPFLIWSTRSLCQHDCTKAMRVCGRSSGFFFALDRDPRLSGVPFVRYAVIRHTAVLGVAT